MSNSYFVLAFYHLVTIKYPKQEMKIQKAFCENLDMTGRVYIAQHGINGQMCGSEEAVKAYMEWMKGRAPFENVQFKIHTWHEHVFPRLTIKTKSKVVAIDQEVDFTTTGEHVPPKKWREMLESEEKPLLLDVRNDYEWDIGRFKGSERPPCTTFRDFDDWANQMEEKKKKSDPIMMYCTGGIRCELFSSMLKKRGFEKVYQLDGGVINYGLEEGSDHWEGKLFVFDDRLAVPISEEPHEIVGSCHFCNTPNDTYYNCANMDCNELFLCCPTCLTEVQGCCKEECKKSTRVRAFHESKPHKPFRRKHLSLQS